MKNLIILILVISVIFIGFSLISPNKKVDNITEKDSSNISIKPVSHASFIMEWGDIVIYNDPVGGQDSYLGQKDPDIIFISDIHQDHLSVDTLKIVNKDKTIIIAPKAVADKLPQDLLLKTIILTNGVTTTQKGFNIETVPMYNLPESTTSPHTKGRGNGYIIEREGERVYIAGDTADIPEMRALKDIDIAFIPMNLPYTMTVEDAALGVLAFSPKKVYPYHYRGQDGLSDIAKFKELVSVGNANIEVVLINWYPEIKPISEVVDKKTNITVEVIGDHISFDKKEIKVKHGDIVTINFSSTNGFHDWVVDEFNAKTNRIKQDEKTSVTFVADKKGIFEYYCSVGEHRSFGMVGKLIVE